MTHVLLLAAPRGAGKTTACQRFVALARHAGLRVGGILSQATYDVNGNKTGIDAVDILSEEQRPLALIDPQAPQRTIGIYRFDSEAIAWARDRVLLALSAPMDAVVIDEIGPLELSKGGGFASALDQLSAARSASVLLVVRSELAMALHERLVSLNPTTVTMTLCNRHIVPAQLLEAVWSNLAERPSDS